MKNFVPISFTKVKLEDDFWSERLLVNQQKTLKANYNHLKEQGRIDAWKWRKGKTNKPHIFWDSDVAKWIEAVSYCLANKRNKSLEQKVDHIVDLMAEAQLDDGYLNSYFINVEPDRKWTNLRNEHELYCAGHLIEAAVAYFDATKKSKFLNIMIRYANLINKVFGSKKNQKKGYPGHQEIELALVRLYRVTKDLKYLNLAKFFLLQRGQDPKYFELEQKNFEKAYPEKFYMAPTLINRIYSQTHKPVIEQEEVVGHAVRAVYMYSGMTDVAKETNDKKLKNACKKLWGNLTQKRMYITGGIGPTHHNEGFTFDYDLPNETAYAETCASIALAQWAHRMFHLEPNSEYIDVLERAIYNGIISGLNLSGDRFFYSNRLAALPEEIDANPHRFSLERQPWFSTACCPTNIVRFLPSIPGYIYSNNTSSICINLYIQSSVKIDIKGSPIIIRQKNSQPWNDKCEIAIKNQDEKSFNLFLRVPYWSKKFIVKIDKKSFKATPRKGYIKLPIPAKAETLVEVNLGIGINIVTSHPNVRQNHNKIAIQRGPIVYCMEESDNGKNLHNILIEKKSLKFRKEKMDNYKYISISGNGKINSLKDWSKKLYKLDNKANDKKRKLKLIPYYLWANRKVGEMKVWFGSD